MQLKIVIFKIKIKQKFQKIIGDKFKKNTRKVDKIIEKMFKTVEYANVANRIAYSAENLYKLGTRLELSQSRGSDSTAHQRPGAYLTYITKTLRKFRENISKF